MGCSPRFWGAPPEISGNVSEAENLAYAEALMVVVNADGTISDAERAWIIGYANAAGNSASNIETLSSYAGEDDLGALFIEGVQQVAQRVCIGDAVRACGADGELAPEELAMIHRIAERLDLPAEVVDEFVDIYQQEQALKARRAALAFPQGVAATAGA